jgi:Mrp family chromosome partitioning ATPase
LVFEIEIDNVRKSVNFVVNVVNLAVALANKCELKIGLLDADVYGPSVPIMMNINQKPQVNQGKIHR